MYSIFNLVFGSCSHLCGILDVNFSTVNLIKLGVIHMHQIDLDEYLKKLKKQGVDVSQIESRLNEIISSSASKQPPATQ